MLFANTSRCCSSLRVDTNSCVYPWRPISCPASTILRICFGNDSAECAGVNQVALMLYLSHSLSRRSIPTVAPNTPREMSVGLAGAPVLVFSLEDQQHILGGRSMWAGAHQPAAASMSIPYEHSTRFGIVMIGASVTKLLSVWG